MCVATIHFYSFKFFNLKYEENVVNLIQKKNLLPPGQLKRFDTPFLFCNFYQKSLPNSPSIPVRTYLRYKARV